MNRMLSRLLSLSLTLVMLSLSVNLVWQSQTLATLRDQVTAMEGRLGSAQPPDSNKIWIKLVESSSENCVWRLYMPPIHEYCLSQVTSAPDGRIFSGSSRQVNSTRAYEQQSMIRISISELQGRSTYCVSLLGSRSEGTNSFLPSTLRSLPKEAYELIPFGADNEKVLDLHTPIPLLLYRVKEEHIQSQLNAGTIDATEANQLRHVCTWYFGTPEAMAKIKGVNNFGRVGRRVPR